MKKCNKCSEIKDLSCFNKKTSSRDGLAGQCRACCRKYYTENRQKILKKCQENYILKRELLIQKSRDFRKNNKEIVKKTNKQYYDNNKSSIVESTRAYFKENREKMLDKMKKYHIKNIESIKNRKKEYRKNNQPIINAANNKRRCQKINATPKWLTKEDFKKIKNIYIQAKELEKLDGIKRHVDHIVPLQGEDVCGLHVPWNLQILTALENIKKGNR